MIFVDTSILIDYSRSKLNIDFSKEYCINSIVRLEFKVGALNKKEMKKINKILSNFYLLEIDQSVLKLADELVEKYALSHNIGIYDSIIAATCLIYDLPLWTHNKKDFRYIENIRLV